MDTTTLLYRLALALILGGIIGWTREVLKKPAGLVTFMLVSLGSAAFAITALELDDRQPPGSAFNLAYLFAGAMTGIGFLGAGTIIKQDTEHVVGLTTAAAMWVASAVGLAAGFGYGRVALVTTLLVLLALFVVNRVKDAVLGTKTECPPQPEDERVEVKG